MNLVFIVLILFYLVVLTLLKGRPKAFLFVSLLLLSVNPIIQKLTDPTIYGNTFNDITFYRIRGDIVFIVFILILLLSHAIPKNNNSIGRRTDVLLLTWFFLNFFVLFFGVDIERSLIVFVISVLGPLLFYYAVRIFLFKYDVVSIVKEVIPFNIIIHILIGFLLFYRGFAKYDVTDPLKIRAVGGLWIGNVAIQMLAIYLPLVFLKLTRRRFNLLLKIMMMSSIVLLLFVSFSRTGFLLGIIMIILALFYKIIKWKWGVYIPILSVLVFFIVIVQIRPEITNEIQTRFMGNSGSVATQIESDARWDIFANAIQVAKNNPFVGIGLGNFEKVNVLQFSNAHNLFFEYVG